MMKDKKLLTYIGIEATLYLALLVLQIVFLSQGYNLLDKSTKIFPILGGVQVGISAVSFIFAFFILFIYRKNELIISDLFTIYFSLIFIADIFFSTSPFLVVAHFMFVAAYILFMIIRKAKYFEYILVAVISSVLFFLLKFVLKMDILYSIADSLLATLLILNCITCWLQFVKNKNRRNLLLSLAVSIILISDLTIAIRVQKIGPVLSNFFYFLTWPTYIAGDIMFLTIYFTDKKASINTIK